MDLIYSLHRRTPKTPPNLNCLSGAVTLCAVSCNNVVAFTAITELNDTTNVTWGCHVYVADLNTPWNSYKVCSDLIHVTSLEWDLPGKLLLVCDASGELRVYASPNHLINQWICVHTASFKEHILAAAFFHNGKKISLISEKKDNALYNEKFNHLRFACSVRGFGGRPAEGALVVTSTGLLGTALFPRPCGFNEAGPTQAIISTDSLGATRKHITAIDICYGKNGHFLIAVSGGSILLPIQCYRVSVRKVDEKCVITSQALPSFFLQDVPVIDKITVSHLRWVTREDADSLVVGALVGTSNCLLQVWELHETALPVHHLLGSATDTPPFNTVLWRHQSKFEYSSPLVSLNTSKLCISNSVPPTSFVLAAMQDNTIHCLYRDSLKLVCHSAVNIPCSGDYDSNSPRVSHIDTSWLGNILLAVDTHGQTYMFKLQPVNETHGSPLTVSGVVTMLEYCIVSGLDCLDILLACSATRGPPPGNLLEAVCDRLTETFNRQLAVTQQYYYVQFLYIKTALYRLSSQSQAKANDLTNLLMLHSIATAFKSLLRPSDMSSHDKTPADSLAAVMTESQTDVDKVLMHLEAKEFTVEPRTLQSLQQLIQWVADLALSLLARLPNSPAMGMQKNTGYELLKDVKALNTLRELLVIIRIWGLLRPACLPVFGRSSENHDAFAHLFRLLSHLAQNPQEPDDTLIDECCQLPNQVTIPQFNNNGSRIALATPLMQQQNFPLQFEYSVEPEFLCYVGGTDPSNVYPSSVHKQIVDCIRHAYLGKAPRRVRACARCGGRARAPLPSPTHPSAAAASQPPPPPPPTTTSRALRAWEQRWLTSCKCGGPWTISTVS